MFTIDQIKALLTALAKQRPVFYSEADFQHALAWLIRTSHPDIHVRLEKPISDVGEVDILLRSGKQEFLIELKYKTCSTNHDVLGEAFNLCNHGAQPLGRYDGLKDISRIERSTKNGCTIFLTNESQYWRVQPKGKAAAFSLSDGRNLSPGELNWSNNISPAWAKKDRAKGIKIEGHYRLTWEHYGNANLKFQYLLLMVKGSKA